MEDHETMRRGRDWKNLKTICDIYPRPTCGKSTTFEKVSLLSLLTLIIFRYNNIIMFVFYIPGGIFLSGPHQ